MKDKTKTTLELLLLNELLQRNVIDDTLYQLAKAKIINTMRHKDQPLATA